MEVHLSNPTVCFAAVPFLIELAKKFPGCLEGKGQNWLFLSKQIDDNRLIPQYSELLKVVGLYNEVNQMQFAIRIFVEFSRI